MQNIVCQGAALSQFFWPPRDGIHKSRGDQLRESLSVENSSPLRNREVRNAIEHFNERLDSYLSEGAFGIIMPSYVGNEPCEDESLHHLFRAYFTDTAKFVILGIGVEVGPLFNEIMRIGEALEGCRDSGGRLLRTG